jgi:hypothetical protein
LIALVYYYFYAKDLTAERTRIAQERARLASEIADDYGRVRASIEQWTIAAANAPFAGDHVDPDAKSGAFRERPSLYLRLRLVDARTVEEVHRLAKLSPIDGLASCLFRVKGNVGPWAYGDVVSRAEMLGSEYLKDVRETKNDLRLRNLAFALDQYKLKDYPDARDAVKLSEYAIIALDEDPATIPQTSAAYGADATVQEKIASVEHPIRVYIRRLSDGRELLRIRRVPEGTVIQVQGDPTAAAAGLEVRKSQILGCSMANDALELAGLQGAPEVKATPSPLPILAPSATASASASAAPSASVSK